MKFICFPKGTTAVRVSRSMCEHDVQGSDVKGCTLPPSDKTKINQGTIAFSTHKMRSNNCTAPNSLADKIINDSLTYITRRHLCCQTVIRPNLNPELASIKHNDGNPLPHERHHENKQPPIAPRN